MSVASPHPLAFHAEVPIAEHQPLSFITCPVEQEMVAAERVMEWCKLPPQPDVLRSAPASTGCAQHSSSGMSGKSDGLDDEALGLLEEARAAAPSGDCEGADPGPHWLTCGSVSYHNIWVSYGPLVPPALRGVSLEIAPGTNVGICGRTGAHQAHMHAALPVWMASMQRRAFLCYSHALVVLSLAGAGKSTLVSCLLRLTELNSGRITVDGHDIGTIPLQRLRSAIGELAQLGRQGWSTGALVVFVHCAKPRALNNAACLADAGTVPQAPFLFDGSVRENLDPLQLHSSADMVAALQQVRLWDPLLACTAAGGKPSALQEATGSSRAAAGSATRPSPGVVGAVLGLGLGEGAAGLSQGQQQLLCLARMLLRRPALVILDECTAAVDPRTAAIIHQVRIRLPCCRGPRLCISVRCTWTYLRRGGAGVQSGTQSLCPPACNCRSCAAPCSMPRCCRWHTGWTLWLAVMSWWS